MKRIPWHNPAQQTPPEGYRLLILEEVESPPTHKGMVLTIFKKWVALELGPVHPDCTYAVPSDTPLPKGYTLIDGDVWQMNGWTAHTPGALFDVTGKTPMDPDTLVEVMLRNGEKVTGPMMQHWFGRVPSEPRAEVIGWRVLDEAPKPLMALDAHQLHPMFKDPVEEFAKDRNAALNKGTDELLVGAMAAQPPHELLNKWQEELRKVLIPLMGKAFEAAHRELLDENQRLKNQLADAQATIKSIRSLLP
jgi:hypothetical protein